jgi:site-specific DNA-cytosine methylase
MPPVTRKKVRVVHMAERKLPCLDLFSGIGGNSLALRSILRTVAYCEIDPFSTSVLEKNIRRGKLDAAPVFPDVAKLKATDLPVLPVVITASFPCQDISAAGTGGGLDGDRSGLVSHIFRLIDQLARAPFKHAVAHVFMENSPFIRTRGLDALVRAFEKRGYKCKWTLLTAQEVGARHVRRRWFMIASRNAPALPRAKPARFAFDKLDAVPRLLKDLSPEEKRIARMRYCALGNSVVPSAVAAAWNVILGDERIDKKGDSPLLTFSDGRQMRRWITPVRETSHFYPTERIDGRHFHMFATQVFHERDTMRRFRYDDVTVARKRYTINPAWVETLMGYPTGWTTNR